MILIFALDFDELRKSEQTMLKFAQKVVKSVFQPQKWGILAHFIVIFGYI